MISPPRQYRGAPAAEAVALLDDLLERGLAVYAEGDALYVVPRSSLSNDEAERIRRHKADLLRMLAADNIGVVRLTLRPLSSPVPSSVRLRRALKTLLRAFRLRCTLIE